MGLGVPVVVQRKRIRLGTMKSRVWSLASLRKLRIQRCCELWCRLQMRLGSDIAVAVTKAGSCGSNWTPSLGTSIWCGCGLKNLKKKKKRKKERKKMRLSEVTGGARIWMLAYMNPQPMCFPVPFVFLKWELKCPSSEHSPSHHHHHHHHHQVLITLLHCSPGHCDLLSTTESVQLGFHLLGSCSQIIYNLPLPLQDWTFYSKSFKPL